MIRAATPAAIGFYTDHGAPPSRVSHRAWRGIEIQRDGSPGRTGNAILERVRELRGDLGTFVREDITDRSRAWRSYLDGTQARDRGFSVGPACVDGVCFAYVLDRWARRLDVFATHAGAAGERVASVWFDTAGVASIPELMIPKGSSGVPGVRVVEAA